LALEADFVLVSEQGQRSVPAGDFFTGPKQTVRKKNELLKEIIFSGDTSNGVSGFRMIGKRKGQAISQVNCAVWLQMQQGSLTKARVAVGSVAPVPLRLEKTEQYLVETSPEALQRDALTATVKEEIAPIDDVRSTAEYRGEVTGALIWEIVAELTGKGESRGN
jgi:CO/xanthine dehydrogenase FAD-binding subunit